MAKNYLVYPTKTMNITQTHSMGNHAAHNSGSPKDYPFDEACADSGRSWFYCPCDEMKIVKIYGVGAKGVNTIWMTSTSKVVMPCGTDYVTIMIEHPEDDDLGKLRVGQTFKRGAAMFREGGNGSKGKGTYGNHFHISIGLGQIEGSGWVANSKGSWVLTTTGALKKATDCFYLEDTKIRNSRSYTFKAVPKEEPKPVVKEDPKPATKEEPKDNTPDKYAKEAIEWAVKNGLLKGDEKGNYKLHSKITRQDMLVFLDRYNKL